jgi:primosomal protein N' (replication factor Y)
MERVTIFADVIVPLAVPNKYTYRVPEHLNSEVMKGKRVIVQFGKTKFYTGIIYNLHHTPPKDYVAKYVEGVLDESPVVTDVQLQFWDWLAFYYCANPGDVMNAALPSGLKLQSTSVVCLSPSFNPEESEAGFLNDKEETVVSALLENNNLSFDDVAQLLDVKTPQLVISRLLKKGAVVVYEDVHERYKPKLEVFVQRSKDLDEGALHQLLDQLEKKAFRQAETLLNILHLEKSGGTAGGWIKRSELLKKNEAGAIKALVKKGVIVEREFETGRLLFEQKSTSTKTLSALQQKAYAQVKEVFDDGKPCLLHGVTGSGKTEVYIQLIRDELAVGKNVLMLIPEIALTTQLITRLRAAFGDLVGVYHSRFSENERVEIWNHVLAAEGSEHKYRIILGARSALFTPFSNLGLVIIDEEHDSSFKQHDPAPRYHARDAAIFLASLHRARVLLGSATPSLESYFNAKQGKYGMVRLAEQYVKGGGTKVELCDTLYYSNSNQMRASLTPPLFDAIAGALKNKSQVILFQNRRGFAPYTECKQCGHVPHCIQCDVSLIYHKQQQKLICHYCGYNIKPPSVCAACGSNQLHFKGLGTEQIEEDIEVLFPGAKIARMDLDSTRSKHAYKQLIDDFEGGNIDILVGTQMVTKGLDFTNVGVVGVLNADSILNFPDFRSFERAYQLLTQVRGRAGRSDKVGKVLVQTTLLEHHVLNHVIEGTYNEFMEECLKERKDFHYPPYTRLFEINIVSKDVNEVNHLSQELYNLLAPRFPDQLLGPEFPMVSRIRNQYYKRLLIKVPREQGAVFVRQQVFQALNELQENHRQWKYRAVIDADPV